ncbi:aspartic peptidase domain-containing protein [Mycena rebaudengoi]|nr:aspartic peptidase domain-containing protein [Mycena rebaudengoi]
MSRLSSPLGLFLVLLAVHLSSALKISVNQVRRPASDSLRRRSGKFSVHAAASDDNGLDLTTVHDLLYMANISVGNTAYPVQLDTGSSDVWIKGAATPLPGCTDTPTTKNLTYGIGWVFGHIAYGPVQFAGIKVESQAFLDVSSADNPALGYDADGLVGLGFTSLSSIDHILNGTGASTGRSLLYNLFEDNPDQPNFIAFALQRTSDSSSNTVQGSFSIGEVEPEYAAVMDSPAIPTWPVTYPSRWNVLLEALLVGTTTVTPTTVVKNAPSDRAVVLLDSGTSYTYAPTAICDAIYSGVSGAQFVESMGQWTVPCDAEIDIALQFGGQIYPIHPLDVTPASLGNSSLCVGSFVPQTISVGAGEFDWLVGDNVLRSLYSIYDFGDFDSSHTMGNPYVKLLSLVEPNQASKEFHAVRGGTALTNITYNASNNTGTTTSTVTVSSDISDSLNKIVALVPAMLGIMALNAVVLITLIIFGILFFCRKRKTKATTRKTRGRLSPMPMDPRNSYIAGPQPQPHVYEPVSMALTDDLDRARPMSMNPRDSFVKGVPLADRAAVSMALSEDDVFMPPSPVARTFKGSGLRPADRPSSSAYQRQPSMAISEDDIFVPPSPGFRSFDGNPGDRPRSVNYQRQSSMDSLVPQSIDNDGLKSVAYQRSPSEEDSLNVMPATTLTTEPAAISPPPQQQPPPPPQRQAPPPPQRSPHRQSSQPLQPPMPQRQPSQESVRLTDDQFSGAPAPRRQGSNLFVPRTYAGQPGDRPQSFAPDSFALAPPTPAFHSDSSSGGRPKSIA